MPLKSATYTEGPRLSDFLLVEVEKNWCRESVSLAPTTLSLPMGTVLAPDGTGHFVPYMTDLADANQADKAVCVTLQQAEISEEAQDIVVIMRGCVLSKAHLCFDPAVTDAEMQNAIADLKALGIVCKE